MQGGPATESVLWRGVPAELISINGGSARLRIGGTDFVVGAIEVERAPVELKDGRVSLIGPLVAP